MKTIGLIGGTGWASSVEYYRLINEHTNQILGGLNYSHCILYSINYENINKCNKNKDYEGVYSIIYDATQKLVSIGAEGIALCANTLHFLADRLQKQIPVPIVHIADTIAIEIQKKNIDKVGLLGTLQTMQQDFYKAKLQKNGIETLIPAIDDMNFINNTILYELFNKEFKQESKNRFLRIMSDLQKQGAEGIVLGCTEIPLLLTQSDFDLPLFDTLQIHVKAIVDFSLD